MHQISPTVMPHFIISPRRNPRPPHLWNMEWGKWRGKFTLNVKLTGCSVCSGPLGGFWLSCQFCQRRHLGSWSYCSVRADTGHQRLSRSLSRWRLLPGGLPIRRWTCARSITSCGHWRGQQSDRRSAGSLPGDHHRRPVSSNKQHAVNGHQKEYMPQELSTVLLLLPNR